MNARSDLPEILKPIYFDFHWSQKKLWALELAAEPMSIESLIWLLELPVWPSNPPHKIFGLRPIEVMNNLNAFPKHKEKIDQADIRFPLHVMFWKERWIIMDGYHRLLKHLRNKESVVQVYKVPKSSIPLITSDKDKPCGYARYEQERAHSRKPNGSQPL